MKSENNQYSIIKPRIEISIMLSSLFLLDYSQTTQKET